MRYLGVDTALSLHSITTARHTRSVRSMSAAATGATAPPPLPITRSAQPPPSQVEFLISQVRATLRYLCEIGNFDTNVYRQIHDLLTRGTIASAPLVSAPATSKEVEAEKEELGKRNAWLRKVLGETSLLPTTVETALSLTTGPLLSSDQQQAIVELVQFSQKAMADKITDPSLQRRTLTGARTAQTSTARAVSGWGKGWKEKEEKRRTENSDKKEQKRREKEEKRQIKEELKKERNQVILSRQQQMLRSDSAASSVERVPMVASPPSSSRTGSLSLDPSVAALNLQTTQPESSSSDSGDEDVHQAELVQHGPINANSWRAGSNSIADTATLTVLSDPIPSYDQGSGSHVGGSNMTFVAEPGLAISCSLVVVRGGKEVHEKLQLVRSQNAAQDKILQAEGGSEGAPPRPPPPSHPEVLAMRRQGSGVAPSIGSPAAALEPTLTGRPQPVIPPRPNTSRTR